MPKSIGQVQKANLNFLSGVGSNDFEKFDATNIFEVYGEKFIAELARQANIKGVVASGDMLRESYFKVTPDGKTLEIWMPDYFDYPNQGVKGVKSFSNAPSSPYKFKNYGMSNEGRASIKRYIESGHAKIKTVEKNNDKALGIGRERKHLSLIDLQTETLIYLIKRFGIKATGYFDATVENTFDDFMEVAQNEFGTQISLSIERFKNGNNN